MSHDESVVIPSVASEPSPTSHFCGPQSSSDSPPRAGNTQPVDRAHTVDPEHRAHLAHLAASQPQRGVVVDWEALASSFSEPLPDDQLPPGQRWSRYDAIGVLTGPEPVPGWLVTDDAAVETELGVLKTGKEADAHLLERAVPGGGSCLLVAKRYRDLDHRMFRRDQGYTEGRGHRDSREARAMRKGSRFGREVAGATWATAEFGFLCRLYEAGVPVPYPVQLDGSELLLELVTDAGQAAPRLAQLRPGPEEADDWAQQLFQAMAGMAHLGWAHGDLSPYNVLVGDGRIVVIDVPQVVDVVANPQGADFLRRDCVNICSWLRRQGVDADPESWFAELVAQSW